MFIIIQVHFCIFCTKDKQPYYSIQYTFKLNIQKTIIIKEASATTTIPAEYESFTINLYLLFLAIFPYFVIIRLVFTKLLGGYFEK